MLGEFRKNGEPGRVRREADLLAAARHPGVVELLGVEDHDTTSTLVTARVSGRPLSQHEILSREETAGVLSAVASTLADLHGLGIVHGAVAAEHVVIDPTGRPVLCGFAYGGRAGELPSGQADHSRQPLEPSADVCGLGELLKRLLVDGPRANSERLLRLAEASCAADPTVRPTASEFAAALTDAVPNARLPLPGPDMTRLDALRQERTQRRQRTPSALSSRGRRSIVSGRRTFGAVALALAAVGAIAVFSRGEFNAQTPELSAPAIDSATTPLRTTSAVTAPLVPPATTIPLPVNTVITTECGPVATGLTADTDGDGCLETLHYEAGVLQAGSARWTVGEEGDRVATGDWRCRGRRDLALVHPPTGDIFVFDSWAVLGSETSATAVARVEGAFALRAAELGSSTCQRLVADRLDGPPVVVPVLGGGE